VTQNVIIDDIPSTGKAPENTEASDRLRRKVMNDFQRLIREKMNSIRSNSMAYVNKRARSKSGVTKELRKVLKSATFIAAHPNRFQAGGFVVEDTQYFVLHRPGRMQKAARVDNIIREFVQRGRQASTHFIISQAGALIQMVDLADIAFHCGESAPATNNNSVGVELEGAIGDPISGEMLSTLYLLIGMIAHLSGMSIGYSTILNHSAILPREKTDAWITKRSGNVVVDSRVQRLVISAALARNALGDASPASLYQAPFDPVSDTATKTAEILALARIPGTSFLELSRIQSSAASVAAFSRSSRFAALDRATLGFLAANHSSFQNETLGAGLAQFMRDNNLRVVPVPQTNNVGVLFDPSTGTLNDGEPL